MKTSVLVGPVALTFIVVTGGCGTSAPSRYYMLKPAGNIPVHTIHHEHLQGLKVVVAPAIIPKHLDRPVLVAFSGEHELVYSEFERWAEPLADNVTRVLIGNLDQLLAGAHVVSKALVEERSADYIIRPQVASLRIQDGETIGIDLRWNIIRGADYASVGVGRFAKTIPLTDTEEVTAVAAANDLLLEASHALAGAFTGASGSGGAD